MDLLIIGGGITGAGIALDAVLRGFRVGLIDKGDFASGTSSASSKLIHGGLRYLEQGRLRLVYEALRERGLLLKNAPHVVHPLRFIIPFYKQARVPAWKWRAGLLLYDVLAGRANIHRSGVLDPRRMHAELPRLRRAGLTGGVAYYDAQMDDARLCLEVLQTAASRGACIANYVEAVAFERQGGQISGLRAVDRLRGQELTIRARQVVNAAGPWVDAICRLAGDDGGPYLLPTKGVHLLAGARPPSAALLLLHPRDGRVFFVIPWPRPEAANAITLIGTTDTLFEEGPDSLTVTWQDVDYLLEGYNYYLSPPLSREEIRSKFVGLRPLLRKAELAGEKHPSSLSREFRCFFSASGLLTIAGGKYTTYRRMAEIATNAVAQRLGSRRPSRTRHCRLDGAPAATWELFRSSAVASLSARYNLPDAAVRHLVDRYGRRADDVAHYLQGRPELGAAIIPGEPDLAVEFVYQRNHEMAVRPEDFLLRRTHLARSQPAQVGNIIFPE
jgi:glycerol-3-phosphate dehydrogenase